MTRLRQKGDDVLVSKKSSGFMNCADCLQGIISGAPCPAIVISDGDILSVNKPLVSFLERSEERILADGLDNIFPNVPLKSIASEALKKRKSTKLAREILIGTRRAALRFSFVPVNGDLVLLWFEDLEPIYQAQLLFLRQIRRAPLDHLWVVDEDLIITHSSLENPDAFGVNVGDNILNVWPDETDRAQAEENFHQARITPGVPIRTKFNLRDGKGFVPVEIGGMFVHAPNAGGYYLLAAHSGRVGGNDAVNRLKQAYDVVTDAQLAAALGKSKSTISNARREGLDPAWAYAAIASTGYSGDWIMTGKGNMLFRE